MSFGKGIIFKNDLSGAKMTKKVANILIVDDMVANRNMLCDLTKVLGHTAILAEDGLMALKKIKEQAIDLVLLDIMMQKMDGYEVLSHIKDDVTLQDIPVIMITALDDMDSAVNCIKMGADDYLTKPFKTVLLRAKIGACLERKFWHDKEKDYLRQIKEFNEKLEERVREKTQELAMINKRLQLLEKAKGDALKLIYYRFQNSLQGLFKKTVQAPLEEANELMETVKQSFQLTKVDPNTIMYVFELKTIGEILKMTIESTSTFAQSRNVYLGAVPDCGGQTLNQVALEDATPTPWVDEWENDISYSETMTWKNIADGGQNNEQKKLCAEALAELINTAVNFSRHESTITFSCEPLENEIKLGIHATGRTIAENELIQFFEIPLNLKKVTKGRYPGIGPSTAQNIIRLLLGGSVTVENRGTEGISFIVKVKRDKL